MKIEKLPSGSYRVRKTINKKTYALVFDHKPTQNEITQELYTSYKIGGNSSRKTVKEAMSEYIDSRSNVSSPSTIRSYNTLARSMTDTFSNMNIYKVGQIDIQNEVNNYAASHSPKTVRNYSGLISAVFRTFRPEMIIRTTLPQKKPYDHYKPTENDIKRILEASVNDKYHIAFQLGVMGLRRGEVTGINIDTDLQDNVLHIHQVLVEGDNGWELKDIPKNDTSNRKIKLPEALVNEIREQGYIIDTTPPMIVTALHSFQKELGIPTFRFHDLRHYFASYAHAMGIPDVYIMEMGGWKTEHTMNKIYKEAMADKSQEMQEKIANILLS